MFYRKNTRLILFFLFAFLSTLFLSTSSFAYTERWANYCSIVKNIPTPIYNSSEHFGWKPRIRQIGDAMPPPGGNGGAFYLHPVSTTEPAHLKCRFPANTKAVKLKVAGNRNGDWIMILKVNGETVKTATINGRKWHTFTIPVNSRNKPVIVDLFVKANGWYYEYAFIDEIKPTPARPQQLKERKHTERWVNYCSIVKNIPTPIYNSSEHFGWKPRIRQIGDAMPPPGGNGGAFYLHPVSTTEPAHLKCRFPANTKAIKLKVAGNRNGNWVMILKVNGKEKIKSLINGLGWHTFTIPIRSSGGYVNIDLLVKANGWYYEYAFVDEIKPVFLNSQ
ncbi:hypothetical protein [Desulfurobacterium atlanticum]|uniref:Carbohydrate binding module (Family 6) n=1 Tax=Desulfurobacterium atlanticum TaxID=240169 RepID=A0A239A088_9BACT|nr:hypothetical protein [Desulfurobacterium atlanticum]SNR88701.1 hypothetical protein SAMN06265340_11353 [Desulfurobacterium atlanticum]